MVVIIVNPGPEEAKFTVHKGVLCSQSEYFERLFNSGFRESKTLEVELHDIAVEAFKVALYWCYHQQIPRAENDYNGCDLMEYLLELWLMGDRLLLQTMQNAVMGELCRMLAAEKFIMHDWQIWSIYQNTTSGSILRRLACHCVAFDAMHPYEDEEAEYLECFELLEDFGVHVWQASRRIASHAGGRVATPEMAFNKDFFMIST